MTRQKLYGIHAQNLKISRLLFVLLLVGAIVAGCSDNPTQPADTGTVVDGSTLPSADKALTTSVHCQGNLCTHFGDIIIPGYPGRDYSYIVTPSAAGCMRFDVALHDATFIPQSVIMPAGWTWQIVYLDLNPDNRFIAHGKIANQGGWCHQVLRFSGPQMNAQFQIGFDFPSVVHTVSWDTSDGSVAQWGRPVGVNFGPIHGPLEFKNDGGYTGPGDTVPHTL